MAVADYALTTLAAVRSHLQKQSSDTGQDAVIESLIDAASWTIIQRYGKFAPVETAVTKKFDWDGGHRLSLFPYYLRSATTVVLDTDQSSTSTLSAAVSVNDYALRPKSPLDGVYKWLRLPNHQVNVDLEREVSITGDWGYATVPADVAHACVITVAEWLRRGVQAFGTGFTSEEDAGLAPAGLPMAAKRLLAPYDRHGQG